MRPLKGRLNSSSCPLSICVRGHKTLAEVIAEFIDAKRIRLLVNGVYQTFQPVQQEVGMGMRVDQVSPRSLLLKPPGPQTSFSILGPLDRKNDALVTSILTPRAFS